MKNILQSLAFIGVNVFNNEFESMLGILILVILIFLISILTLTSNKK